MTKNKHDHTATKKIKAWLFAIMLLLPFLFLLPTGLYYGLNQNAQLSERTIVETNYYNIDNRLTELSISELLDNTIYTMSVAQGSENDITIPFKYLEINTLNQTDLTEVENVSSSPSLYFDTNDIIYVRTGTKTYSIDNDAYIIFVLDDLRTLESYENIIGVGVYSIDLSIASGENTTTTYTNDISTSIINAWNSTWQNPLFSWTSYSPFYAPMQSFTNVFGINNMQIANILTYLATITAIYIVFDIIIELFTYLTHLIPRSD